MASPEFVSPERARGRRQDERETAVAASRSRIRRIRRVDGGPADLIRADELFVGTELMSDVTVVSLAGEIDLATVEQFAGALRMHLYGGAPTVVIDLAGISFISVDGGRVLLRAVRQARWRGVAVRVVRSRAVRRVIAVFGAVAECETGSVGPAT
jgi:anti-anti-sigma factor